MRRSKKSKKLDTRKVAKKLAGVKSKLRALMDSKPAEIGEGEVTAAKDIAAELEEINRQFKETLKRAMMADGKIKPGQTITAGGRYVRLAPRPGCPPGSTNPDDYDLVTEPIS